MSPKYLQRRQRKSPVILTSSPPSPRARSRLSSTSHLFSLLCPLELSILATQSPPQHSPPQAHHVRSLLRLVFRPSTRHPCLCIVRCTTSGRSQKSTPLSRTPRRLTGRSSSFLRTRSGSGTASPSVASGRRAVTEVVSISVVPTCFLLSHCNTSLALYEADKKAHEEAVSNGGVRACRSVG